MLCLFPSRVLQLLLLSFYTLKLCHFHPYHSLPHTAVFTVSELLPNQSSSVLSKKSGMQHSPLARSSPCIHSHAALIQWPSDPGCFIFLWGEHVLSCQEPFWAQLLHRVSGGSCALSAAPGTTCSFDIISHSLWPQLLSSPAAVRCLWNVSNSEPSPLAAACLGFCSKGSSARFFIKSPGISPLVFSPRSYSSSQLLFWHLLSFTGPGLYQLLMLLTTLQYFFLTKNLDLAPIS